MKAPVWVGVALSLAVFSSVAAVGRNEPITESDAIRIFLEDDPRRLLASLDADAEGADASIGTEWTNPVLSYQVEDAAGVQDEFLTLQQQFPVSGRRSILREGASASADAAELRGEWGLENTLHALRIAFYEVLYRDEVVKVLWRGHEEMEGMVEILRERERAGESSGYDVLRSEQEAAELHLELERAEAEMTASRARFGAFFGESRAMRSAAPVGDFSVAESSLAMEGAVAIALAERKDRLALEEDARRHELDLRATRRLRLPEPTLSAGWKRVEALGRSDTGYFAAIMVPLPLFERGRFEAARSHARAGQIEMRQELLEREIRGEVESAFVRMEAARANAASFGDQVEGRAKELRRMASLAYDEGEQGLLELLDAFRTSLRMELQALSARHEAKRAQIELDRSIGREVHP